MLEKFVSWQRKRYTQRQKILLAFSLSTVFIFLFIPALPFLLFENIDKNFNLPTILTSPLHMYVGLPLAAFGLSLFFWTITLFLKFGEGTQTPVVPTQKLVTVGPFTYYYYHFGNYYYYQYYHYYHFRNGMT